MKILIGKEEESREILYKANYYLKMDATIFTFDSPSQLSIAHPT